MADPNYHLTGNNDDGWDIKREGADRASAHFDDHDAALERGREMAGNQGVRLILHDSTGQITGSEDPQTTHEPANDPGERRDKEDAAEARGENVTAEAETDGSEAPTLLARIKRFFS